MANPSKNSKHTSSSEMNGITTKKNLAFVQIITPITAGPKQLASRWKKVMAVCCWLPLAGLIEFDEPNRLLLLLVGPGGN